MIIGIDIGKETGLAIIDNSKLTELHCLSPFEAQLFLDDRKPLLAIMEDSRLQKHIWTANGRSNLVAKNISRKVGSVDGLCQIFEEFCRHHDIKLLSISPKNKGSKINATDFKKITGYTKQSNQHTRDAAMVAWPYRYYETSKRI